MSNMLNFIKTFAFQQRSYLHLNKILFVFYEKTSFCQL